MTTPEELEEIRVAAFISGAVHLGISASRARFLAACSYNHFCPATTVSRPFTVPYSDLPLIAEAARLGINASDTAAMMGMTTDQIHQFGIKFPRRTTRVLPAGTLTHNLLGEDED